jgi:hypothetical protein
MLAALSKLVGRVLYPPVLIWYQPYLRCGSKNAEPEAVATGSATQFCDKH